MIVQAIYEYPPVSVTWRNAKLLRRLVGKIVPTQNNKENTIAELESKYLQ